MYISAWRIDPSRKGQDLTDEFSAALHILMRVQLRNQWTIAAYVSLCLDIVCRLCCVVLCCVRARLVCVCACARDTVRVFARACARVFLYDS